MTPGYLIIGAQKAGTTSLHEYLAAHPDVGAPATKEVHYFDLEPTRPLSWYRAHFPAMRPELRLTGEATAYYLFHPLVPTRVRAVLPDVRLIVMLREPVDRALSHYHHEVALGFETLSWQDAIEREPERLAGEEERMRRDAGYRSFSHRHHSYVSRSRYAAQLERWLEVFPRQQLLVIVSEDLFARPAATLHRVQRWLGLSEHTPNELTPRNARSYARLAEAGADAVRQRLEDDLARLPAVAELQLPWA